MRSELIPKIKLQIQPMICEMVQAMGIKGSVLEECIQSEIDKNIAEEISKIPEKVKQELDFVCSQAVKENCAISFNTNNKVKVKLTDYGKSIDQNCKVDKEGFSSYQLWELMQIFGKYMYCGSEVPFETEIIICL